MTALEAGISRDAIRQRAELCGWKLDELMGRTIATDRDAFQPEA